jgi:hypothetical protein
MAENEETMEVQPTLYEYTFILKGKRTYTAQAVSEDEAKQMFEESVFSQNTIIDIIESEMKESEPIQPQMSDMRSTRVVTNKDHDYLEAKKEEFAKMFAEASNQTVDGATDNVVSAESVKSQ